MNVENNDLKVLGSDFLDYLLIEKSLSPLTIRDYRHYLDRFISWLESITHSLQAENIDLDLIMKDPKGHSDKKDYPKLPCNLSAFISTIFSNS
jgi:site-specific recombinase XerD